ncbi:hypothetical protein H072_6337 [Dactylellina haptotyla CBS 200.50]|uniref:RBP protein n=1 Tax=Dactylellina haptotyla (strain CBS 200.50) TaxID=1284197 RepID=S8BWV3_DACHA|nr:hypothetical protein H072_6337 [Dactylellina haptotyla CBS 200.50]
MPSQLHIDEEIVSAGSRWIMTEEERTHIASILNLDDITAAGMTAHNMSRSRMTCKSCGKRSGLDDLVSSADKMGIHSHEFMVDVIFNGPHGSNPMHAVDCSSCGDTFEGVVGWTDTPIVWRA